MFVGLREVQYVKSILALRDCNCRNLHFSFTLQLMDCFPSLSDSASVSVSLSVPLCLCLFLFLFLSLSLSLSLSLAALQAACCSRATTTTPSTCGMSWKGTASPSCLATRTALAVSKCHRTAPPSALRPGTPVCGWVDLSPFTFHPLPLTLDPTKTTHFLFLFFNPEQSNFGSGQFLPGLVVKCCLPLHPICVDLGLESWCCRGPSRRTRKHRVPEAPHGETVAADNKRRMLVQIKLFLHQTHTHTQTHTQLEQSGTGIF